MIRPEENISLQKYNTFHLPVLTNFFVKVTSVEDILEVTSLPEIKHSPVLILGDGANILFTKNYNGLIIKNELKGIKSSPTIDGCDLTVGSGEDWHGLVAYAVENGWCGIENLAYIPGTVGAAPVQNIAAYGQELAETFVSLDAVELSTGKIKTFNKEACNFKYRDSIFKRELKDKYFITTVRLKLSKNFKGVDTTYHSRYESLEDELKNVATPPYTLKDIYNAVISIRKKKLPDVNKIGTVGSMFANPFLTREQLGKLQKIVPDIQFYPIDKMKYPKMNDPELQNLEVVKVPAGWLLEEAGWKNKRIGNVGTHPNHALCVIAYDGAKPEEVYAFTEMMRKNFKEKYGIDLQYEVNIT